MLIKTETFYPVELTDSVDSYLSTKGVDKAVTEASKTFLTELLIKSPDSKIYLISYAGRYFKPSEDESENEIVSKTDSPTVNNRDLKKIKDALTKKGIELSRIIVLKGGQSNYTRKIEFYFVPKNSEIPKPKPHYIPKKKRS